MSNAPKNLTSNGKHSTSVSLLEPAAEFSEIMIGNFANADRLPYPPDKEDLFS